MPMNTRKARISASGRAAVRPSFHASSRPASGAPSARVATTLVATVCALALAACGGCACSGGAPHQAPSGGVAGAGVSAGASVGKSDAASSASATPAVKNGVSAHIVKGGSGEKNAQSGGSQSGGSHGGSGSGSHAGVHGSADQVRLTARGAGFSDAARVSFEVLNTSDPKAHALQIEGQADHTGAGGAGTWTATVDPAVPGTGVYRITAQAYDAAGAPVHSAQTEFTYRATFRTSDRIELTGGDYNLTYGTAGLKVLRVQRVVGIGLDRYPRYLDATMAAVTEFQKRHNLPATGVVDEQTWLAMGLDLDEWHTLGAYVSPATVDGNASGAERIEAMVNRAMEYLGDLYEWDASGKPGQGIDCAGLVIQALYAAGCDTGIVNPVTHSTTTWGDQDALNLFSYCSLVPVDYSQRRRGDLVFYSLQNTGAVDHVAIYLGNDQIIEAHPKGVRISKVDYATVLGVRRVFA